MKSIAVVTDGKNNGVEQHLNKNLDMVFKGFVNINNYHFKDLKDGYIIEDDVVLIMIKERILTAKKYVQDSKKIVVINRTIKDKEVYKIFSIPENMDVLVVNDNKETTIQMMSLLYQIGINHLNLIPYDKNKEYPNIKIAITPEENSDVPSYIEKIINVGQRCIDISTFIHIINKLNMDNKEINSRLIKYTEQVINYDTGIKNKYKELFIKNEELDTIINLSRDGIVLTSKDGKIIICSKRFKEIFDINQDILGLNINSIFAGDMKRILEIDELKNEVFKFKNKYINVNKNSIIHFDKKTGMYFNVQEITYIKQLEQNLSKKLREKGHIARYNFDDIISVSSNMERCKKLARKIADSELTTLITGESGTGKELFAQSIHNASKRKNQPFIAVNCAAMPENLLESELFGYEAGAFTGALKEGKKGLFEQANHGTIFLDEIGDMPMYLQTKLLRVLQERQVMRVGSQKVIDIDVRVIAATNRNLLKMIQESKFRNDLFYRVNVLPIKIPSLKERKDDILLLLNSFTNNRYKLSDEVKKILAEYNWPGNIRELMNVSSYINTMCEENIVNVEDLPFDLRNIEHDYTYETQILHEKKCFENSVEIMKIINRYNESNKSLGRNNIVKALQSIDIFITEGEVRKILLILNELGLIISSVGRKGSKITEKGKQFIKII